MLGRGREEHKSPRAEEPAADERPANASKAERRGVMPLFGFVRTGLCPAHGCDEQTSSLPGG